MQFLSAIRPHADTRLRVLCGTNNPAVSPVFTRRDCEGALGTYDNTRITWVSNLPGVAREEYMPGKREAPPPRRRRNARAGCYELYMYMDEEIDTIFREWNRGRV